jgi:hypothetical protein
VKPNGELRGILGAIRAIEQVAAEVEEAVSPYTNNVVDAFSGSPLSRAYRPFLASNLKVAFGSI